MSAKPVKLYDHEAEARCLSILADVSTRRVGEAKALLDKHPLTPEDFHLSAHGEVFAAIREHFARDLPADPVALMASLRASRVVEKAGGVAWLTKLLVNEGFIETAFPSYAKTVQDMATRRALYRHAKELMDGAMDLTRDTRDVVAGGKAALESLIQRQPHIRSAQAVALEFCDELDAIHRGERVPVVPTGIHVLDKVIGGLQRRKLTVLGAEPSAGKSAIAATILESMAARGTKCAIFSLEDHPSWLVARHVANRSGVPLPVLRNLPLRDYQREAVNQTFQELWAGWANVLIDAREFLTPRAIADSMVDLIVNHGVHEFIIDNLAEVKFEKAHRDRPDLNILEGLQLIRAVLKQHDASCLLLTHVTRESQGKAPTLKDFPGSAAIERMARVAIIATPERDGATLWVLKQTEGQRNVKVRLEFNLRAAMVRADAGTIDEPHGSAA